jgi:hypothetical protein
MIAVNYVTIARCPVCGDEIKAVISGETAESKDVEFDHEAGQIVVAVEHLDVQVNHACRDGKSA